MKLKIFIKNSYRLTKSIEQNINYYKHITDWAN